MNEHQKMLKAVLFRAQYRGGKEADTIIGGFARKHAHSLSMEELDSFARMLQHDDHKILYWVEVPAEASELFSLSLLDKLNTYAFKTINPLHAIHL